MKIFSSADQLIGHTPLLELTHIEKAYCPDIRLLAKLEMMNPAGSAKDRVAKKMLDEAVAAGQLAPGGTVIEPTSGNTGIGLAAVAAARGFKAVIVMPDTMSKERIQTIAAYGAEVVLSDGALGMNGAIQKAEELKTAIPGSMIAGQFVNPMNPQAHYETTGPEIWEDTDGTVDLFVAGIGTGGTISGVGRCLKEKNPLVRVVGLEPERSPLLTKGVAGPHKLQGIGANFVPEIFDKTVVDEILTISDEEAYRVTKMIGRAEGILVGITSGAAVAAAIRLGQRPENKGKTVVALLPDTGSRYFSTGVFD